MSEVKEKNALLDCLVLFTKLQNRPFSAESLTAGLPIEEGRTTPELFSTKSSKSAFSRAAKRAGFSVKLVKKELNEISILSLPCMLLLKNKDACIFEGLDETGTHAKILHPDMDEAEYWVRLEDLESEYIGFAYFIKKEYTYENKQNLKIQDEEEHWFWGTLLKSKKIYLDVIIASLMINIFVLASPLFTMNVYDRVVPNNAVETLWVLALGVLVVYALDMILKYIRTYFLETAGKKSDIIMSSILFEKVMDLKMEVKPKSVGSFASNLKEFESIRSFFTSSSLAAVIDLPFVIIFLVVINMIAGAIVVVPMITMVIILGYAFSIKGTLQKSIEATHEASANKNAVLIESLSLLETIKLLGAGGHQQYKWEEATGEIAAKSIKAKLLSMSIPNVTSFFVQVNTIAVVILGVYKIQDYELSMGGLIATVILSSRAIAPMGQVASLAASYQQTKTAYTSLNEIMKMPVERPEGKQFVQRQNLSGKIEFKNVSFTYPEETKKSLENISFTIEPGEKVGIIGRMGSGKTTIEKLIMGLYTPEDGSILMDDIDINQIDPADLRKNIGYVPQDVVLFQGTVKSNIIYKAPYCSDDMLLRAADIAGVTDFVNLHPKGFDMSVGEMGSGLSGGQRQSIAVARGVLLPTPIVMLDEPTNSMDSTSEVRFKNKIKETFKRETLILVTHKSTMLDIVDRLIVMDKGRIVLDGKKDEVLKKLMGK